MTDAEKIAEKHNAEVKAKPAGVGHNRPSLEEYAKRLQNLEEQKQALAEDVRELKAEAKEHDVNPRALSAIVKLRMETDEKREKREAFEEVVDSYKHALGLLS